MTLKQFTETPIKNTKTLPLNKNILKTAHEKLRCVCATIDLQYCDWPIRLPKQWASKTRHYVVTGVARLTR